MSFISDAHRYGLTRRLGTLVISMMGLYKSLLLSDYYETRMLKPLEIQNLMIMMSRSFCLLLVVALTLNEDYLKESNFQKNKISKMLFYKQ